jgi:hypothetical protein
MEIKLKELEQNKLDSILSRFYANLKGFNENIFMEDNE